MRNGGARGAGGLLPSYLDGGPAQVVGLVGASVTAMTIRALGSAEALRPADAAMFEVKRLTTLRIEAAPR